MTVFTERHILGSRELVEPRHSPRSRSTGWDASIRRPSLARSPSSLGTHWSADSEPTDSRTDSQPKSNRRFNPRPPSGLKQCGRDGGTTDEA